MASLAQRVIGPFGRGLQSLRQRVVALFVLVLLLPSLIIAALAFNAVHQQSEQALIQVARYAALASAHEARRLTGVQHTLQSLAVLLADLPAAQCSPRLAAAASSFPEFSAVFLVGAGGGVDCATDRQAIGSSVASRAWFRRVAASPGFIVSDDFGGPHGGPPVVGAILATGDRGAPFAGAIASAVKLDAIAVGSSVGLAGDFVVEFLDAAGAPIMAPSSTGLPDRSLLRPTQAAAAAGFEARDLAGQRRIYGTAPVAGTDMRILIGIPAASGTGWLSDQLFLRIAGLMVLWVLILLAAWIGIDRLVLKWIRRLSRTARAFNRGEPVTMQLDRAPVELRRLGEALSAMAARVDAREAELRGSAARQEWLVRETHHRVKNNLQIVASLVNLRSKALRSPDARLAFADIQMPIRALALVHRHLYDHEERRDVDIRPIIAELCDLFRNGSDVGPVPVSLTSDVEQALLSADRAVAVILLATEALTSAVHHLRPGSGDPGAVSVRLQKEGDGQAVLEIADDAPRRDEDQATAADRLRLSLMIGLARQVGGTLTRLGPPGGGVLLHFRPEAAARPI